MPATESESRVIGKGALGIVGAATDRSARVVDDGELGAAESEVKARISVGRNVSQIQKRGVGLEVAKFDFHGSCYEGNGRFAGIRRLKSGAGDHCFEE